MDLIDTCSRRGFLVAIMGVGVLGRTSAEAVSMNRFGTMGKLTAHSGQRDVLARHLLRAAEMVGHAPGCELYVVHTSPTEADAIWVTEVWRSQADHAASLSMPGIPELIAEARPLIAGMSDAIITVPIGGKGLTVV